MISINEYLLTKNKTNVVTIPEKGCTIDDIVEWLDSFKIKRSKKYQNPKHGEITYEVGPGREDSKYNNKDYYWVALRSCPEISQQSVIAKPYAQSFYWGKDGVEYKITFDEAIELMDKIIKNPNLII